MGLLTRMYEYESGTVTIDGHDIRDLNVRWLRTVIGTVQQEPIIFNDTVENNLRMGCATLTEKQMVEACKMANAHEFIEALPEGYNTRIGDGGVQLSGGQVRETVEGGTGRSRFSETAHSNCSNACKRSEDPSA